MATLLLQTAGAALGGLFGPVGAVLGRAAGALAGYALDQALFGERSARDVGRLADLDVQASREGAAIPRVYGRVRIAGQVIWATRYEEEVADDRGGGKGFGGGASTRTFSYFGNFAVGLCEGPIARLGRVWADGKPFDLTEVTYRVHLGTEDQEPDSLIAAKQGEGDDDAAPAYRGLAYVVFEHLPLEAFGNRLPQLSFEVVRTVPGVEQQLRAVTIIPGATEFGYDTEAASEAIAEGARPALNRHVLTGTTDFAASLDELQALCPALERVALVAAWFGDDLRAGSCAIRPGVTSASVETVPEWRGGGVGRDTARLLSSFGGHAAYGGTPSDASVVRAIQDLSARGLAVTFYPFLMMDIPVGNGLPDPYGGTAQGAYPWRGSITGSVAPGLPGTVDQTAATAAEIAAFVGTATAADFALVDGAIGYSGPAEWSYRRLILHYAHLCAAAGGVDAFLIGSELRGLTTLRSDATTFPFVAALAALAGEVRGVLGPDTRISYAADWSEYFGHQPADGSDDVLFHLDPLWSDPDIDFVAIDNYMPLADWRDGTEHIDAEDWDTGREAAYFRSNIAAGEGYDWYYASASDRVAQVRSPISDGAYGKSWIFRYKDLAAWWGNPHYDRSGGVEAETATAWEPGAKPVWFTEMGCPAVDKGANQPNLFPDAKSAASGLPWFSRGVRDDLVQRRFLQAVLGAYDPGDAHFDAALNPASAAYDGRMVEPATIHAWTWDARPFPAFPLDAATWADGPNYETGHWLNGRLGAAPADGLVTAILADYGFDRHAVGDLDGVLDGYVVGRIGSARDALEPLRDLLGFEAVESGEAIAFAPRRRRAALTLARADLADEERRPVVALRRAQETELPAEIAVGFTDVLADFRATSVSSRRLATESRRVAAAETGAVLRYAVAHALAEQRLRDIWAGRETVQFALPPSRLAVEPGDAVAIELDGRTALVRVTRIADGATRRVEAEAIDPDASAAASAPERSTMPPAVRGAAPPEVIQLDLPLLRDDDLPHAPRLALFADPWPGAIAVALGTADSGFALRQTIAQRATVGVLATQLWPGPTRRWDRVNRFDVATLRGAIASEPAEAVLAGRNLAAVGSAETGWEVLQFRDAELVGAGAHGGRVWRIGTLLRGQAGTEDVSAEVHPPGARFVLLGGATAQLDIAADEAGLLRTLRCGPAGAAYSAARFTDAPVIYAMRGLMPLAPVRLRGRRDPVSGDWRLSWIRRTRIGGDGWEAEEPPLGETTEGYRVEILDGDMAVRSVDVGAPEYLYTAAAQTADFGAPQWAFDARVRQLSATHGPGVAADGLIWNF